MTDGSVSISLKCRLMHVLKVSMADESSPCMNDVNYVCS